MLEFETFLCSKVLKFQNDFGFMYVFMFYYDDISCYNYKRLV
jgi:hypothetical protein